MHISTLHILASLLGIVACKDVDEIIETEISPEGTQTLVCEDKEDLCTAWAEVGECLKNPAYMLIKCPAACNTCQFATSPTDGPCPPGQEECQSCKNKDADINCDNFKKSGECDRYPGWMAMNCAKSCHRCHLLDPLIRCKRADTVKNALNPGDLGLLIERTKKGEFDEFEPHIMSEDPVVIVFDALTTTEEQKRIVEIQPKFERSTDVGARTGDGMFAKVTSQSRTSENSWCDQSCWEDSIVFPVIQRMSKIVNISAMYSEHLQILRYKAGQYYKEHHDYIHGQLHMACGVRVLTFFLYLSDVDEGGETYFPRLNISVSPKAGRAVVWPSVLDSAPNRIDSRTQHEAMPVKKGIKFGANAWFHQYDFQMPNLLACTG